MREEWVSSSTLPLLADLYAFTMCEAYLAEGMHGEAVFSLFTRRLPPRRNYLVACGLETVLAELERFHFDEAALEQLRALKLFSDRTLAYLATVRFTGDVYAVQEGTPIFGNEPILEVVAPIAQAQLLEAWVLNQIHVQTLAASKAARVVHAAAGRRVVDFGLRRMQGADAGLKVARAAFLAGADATSNVLAARLFGIPASGTMAHSYVQAHADEREAFRAWMRTWPDSVLLVDTYDTLAAVDALIAIARELGREFRLGAIRLDSGDLGALAREARRRLDAAGLQRVGIFASGGLDEDQLEQLRDAPITGYGVGTSLAVSDDAPSVDLVYKLVAYDGADRTKLSTGKVLWPGRKQVFRVDRDGRDDHDVLAGAAEQRPGRPLLQHVMRRGARVGASRSLAQLRAESAAQRARLPDVIRALSPAAQPYLVQVSDALQARLARLTQKRP